MKINLIFSLLFATASLGTALGPSWYSCDPTKCTGTCLCPSLTAPGNLAPQDIPQFIIVTHDDAITALANRGVRSVTDGHKNPNGCNVPATWFTTSSGTDCSLVKKLFNDNHEIALHTVHHKQLVPSLNGMEDEIMGAKTFLVKQCGLPADALVGFRSPYLIHNPTDRAILAKNGILYDSSIEEFVGPDSKTTTSFGNRLWPYTMDNGIVQNCNWTYPSGQCQESERYPGMWEIPMWDLLNSTTNTEQNAYTMDPASGFGGDLLTTLKTNFDEAYNGNRAPFPLYVHAPWFTPSNIDSTNKFFEYALSKPNVYFVTIQQLINWMKNPVPVSQLASTLTCKPVDLSIPQTLKCQVYTVKQGDFIDAIAGKFGLVNSTDLLALNPGVTASSIQIGQKLKIPPWDNTCGEGVPAGSAATAPSAEEVLPIVTAAPAVAVPPVADAPTAAITEVPAPATVPVDTGSSATALEQQPVPTESEQLPQQPLDPTSKPPNRVEMLFNLKGMGPTQLDATTVNRFTLTLSQVLGVDASSLLIGLAGNRRRRGLLQDTGGSIKIVAVVSTNDPLTVYYRVQEEIANGDLESMLNALGFASQGPPMIVVFRNGIALQFPDTAVPSTAQKATSNSKLSVGVIAGIVAGSVALVIAIMAAAIYCIKGRKAKAAEEKKQIVAANAKAAYVGGTAHLSIKTIKSKGSSFEDPFKVVKGGVETPTSPTQRTFFKL